MRIVSASFLFKEGLNGGAGSTCWLSVKISLLRRLSVVNLSYFFDAIRLGLLKLISNLSFSRKQAKINIPP